MRATELEPVEHGLAAMIALGLATLGQVLIVSALVPSSSLSRLGLAWCLSDAIPTSVALALLASRPRVTLLRATVAALAVELAAVAACVGLLGWNLWQEGGTARPRALLAEVMTGLYSTPVGALAALTGRSLGLLLAARKHGELLEGALLGWPLAIGWCVVVLTNGVVTWSALLALSGPLVFAGLLTLLLPIFERGTVAAFARLGISEAEDGDRRI